eukprot:jgi/Chlat1/8257/Chrsp78S07727
MSRWEAKQQRRQAYAALQASAEVVRSQLGRQLVLKIVSESDGRGMIAADACETLALLDDKHPVVTLLVEYATGLKATNGTGVTWAVVLAGLLADASLQLEDSGIDSERIDYWMQQAADCCKQAITCHAVTLEQLHDPAVTPCAQRLLLSAQGYPKIFPPDRQLPPKELERNAAAGDDDEFSWFLEDEAETGTLPTDVSQTTAATRANGIPAADVGLLAQLALGSGHSTNTMPASLALAACLLMNQAAGSCSMQRLRTEVAAGPTSVNSCAFLGTSVALDLSSNAYSHLIHQLRTAPSELHRVAVICSDCEKDMLEQAAAAWSVFGEGFQKGTVATDLPFLQALTSHVQSLGVTMLCSSGRVESNLKIALEQAGVSVVASTGTNKAEDIALTCGVQAAWGLVGLRTNHVSRDMVVTLPSGGWNFEESTGMHKRHSQHQIERLYLLITPSTVNKGHGAGTGPVSLAPVTVMACSAAAAAATALASQVERCVAMLCNALQCGKVLPTGYAELSCMKALSSLQRQYAPHNSEAESVFAAVAECFRSILYIAVTNQGLDRSAAAKRISEADKLFAGCAPGEYSTKVRVYHEEFSSYEDVKARIEGVATAVNVVRLVLNAETIITNYLL